MVDQSKVSSGFDVEFLMTAEYVRNVLLTSLETGAFPLSSESAGFSGSPPRPYRTATIIHPPDGINQRRLYPVYPDYLGTEHPFRDLTDVYSLWSDELRVAILADDPRRADVSVTVYPTVIDLFATPPKVLIENASIEIALRFAVVTTPGAGGMLRDVSLQITVVDVEGPLIDAIESLLSAPNPPALPTRAQILTNLKNSIDRSVPFGVAGGGALQRIETRAFPGDDHHPAAIGVYLNLVLRTGPAATAILKTVRGDTSLAQNFLAPDMTMGFAFPGSVFPLLSDDLTFRMAVPDPGHPGEFIYPLNDEDGKRIGTVHRITVRPDAGTDSHGNATFTNTLIIDVRGEISWDHWFDPDFRLTIRLSATQNALGVFDFDVDVRLRLSAVAVLGALFVGIVLSVLFPTIGVPVLLAEVIAMKAIEHFGADAAADVLASQGLVTSFLDTLPHKLVVETRRWDPLYTTDHRIEAAEAKLVVTDAGLALTAGALFLGRRTHPLRGMVIRAETRDAVGAVDGLVYRAPGLTPYLETDIKSIQAAVDRMETVAILPSDGALEGPRAILTLDQVRDRIAAGDRHVADLDYAVLKVDIVGHQIFQMLAMSRTEISEMRGIAQAALRSEYRAQHAAELRTKAKDQLRDDGNSNPTETEIQTRIERLVAAATDQFIGGRTQIELDKRLTFDLEPAEFASLQRNGILTLERDQLEIRQTPDGVLYYRDYERPFEPNTPTWDNLLSRPRYKHTH
jgi:hypothetical protein